MTMKNNPETNGVKKSKVGSKGSSRANGGVQAKERARRDHLNPGLRDRIVAELDGANIPEDNRLHFLSALTGCAPQTVRRWIDSDNPGLPDLPTFALLCDKFNSDANWMLGFVGHRYELPVNVEPFEVPVGPNVGCTLGWVEQLLSNVQAMCNGYEMKPMIGDDMEPRIKDGAAIWVDTTVTEFQTNGVYLVEYERRTLVRQVEIRIGEGLLLSCDNHRYKPTLIKNAEAAKRSGLKILGRVKFFAAFEKL